MGGLYIPKKDDTGRPINRYAISQEGWTYMSHFFEFTSNVKDSISCKDFWKNDVSGFSMNFYDSSGTELTNQVTEININGYETLITFDPGYDFEIIAGSLYTKTVPASDCYVYVAAGIPSLGSAGMKEFVRHMNMGNMWPGMAIKTDGKAPKLMKGDIGVGQTANIIQVKVITPVSILKHDIMFNLELYRA